MSAQAAMILAVVSVGLTAFVWHFTPDRIKKAIPGLIVAVLALAAVIMAWTSPR